MHVKGKYQKLFTSTAMPRVTSVESFEEIDTLLEKSK
jgi:hypothetical protein